VLIALLVFGFVGIFVAAMVRAQSLDPPNVRVIDGDTIAVHGLHDRIRLMGINAPETQDAECWAELELGLRASAGCSSSSAKAPMTCD
jgi:endonuclease YncB( thermonuclease family)